MLEKIMQAKGVLDNFIEKQKKSGNACSARLMEAKRAYDGLLKDVKLLAAQMDVHEKVLEAEKADLAQTMEEIKEVEETFEESMAKCAELKQQALEDKKSFLAELEELKQIANPAARYADTQAKTAVAKVKDETAKALKDYGGFEPVQPGLSLFQGGSWTTEQCQQFLSFLSQRGSHSMSMHAGRSVDPRDCDKSREELQKAFEEAYVGIQDLIKDAIKRYEDKTCVETAEGEKATSMAPLTAQQEESTVRIGASSRAIQALTPTLELVKKRAEKLQEYIDETLTPECYEDGDVSKHLQEVRELIMALEECPGRNDFKLKIPEKKIEEEEPEEAPTMIDV